MLSWLGGCCCCGIKSILSHLLVVAAYVTFHLYLFGHDVVGDHGVVAGDDGGCHVVYFGADYHCSVDEYEVSFVVVKYLLHSVGSSCMIVVLVQNGQCSWLSCLSIIFRECRLWGAWVLHACYVVDCHLFLGTLGFRSLTWCSLVIWTLAIG